MTTSQVVETSVTVNNNSPIQDYVHPDDQTQPFEILFFLQLLLFVEFRSFFFQRKKQEEHLIEKPNLIIVLLYIERILSSSLLHKMFSKFVPILSFPQVLSVFSLLRNQQTAPLPPLSTFLCL